MWGEERWRGRGGREGGFFGGGGRWEELVGEEGGGRAN